MITKEKKKWKVSDKKKLWAAYCTSFNNVQKLASITITVNENELEEINIYSSSTNNHVVKAL